MANINLSALEGIHKEARGILEEVGQVKIFSISYEETIALADCLEEHADMIKTKVKLLTYSGRSTYSASLK